MMLMDRPRQTRIYAKALKPLRKRKIDWLHDDIFVMLCTSRYTPDFAHDKTLDDVTGEAWGIGYAPGGQRLTGKYTHIDRLAVRTPQCISYDAADVAWPASTIVASGAVVYKDTGKHETSRLICYIDFGINVYTTLGNFTITWGPAGIVKFFEPVD